VADRLAALEDMQALAAWLERRPLLGHDVFARGQPEVFGVSVAAAQADRHGGIPLGQPGAVRRRGRAGHGNSLPTAARWTSMPSRTHAIAFLRLLEGLPKGITLDRLLPDAIAPADDAGLSALRWRSAWSSTFIAGLELARQGDVTLAQEGNFEAIRITPAQRNLCTTAGRS
jgi:segregation and condensation protein A